jgi:predicted NAD/FAD-dependent oxidoreductase
MSVKVTDYIIIGAGLTGLSLGWELMQHNSELDILILDKSKSCGGRMATRRIGEMKIDHGAQFLKNNDVAQRLINLWQTEGVSRKFPSDQVDAICGESGITQLTKSIASHLDVIYNQKVAVLKSDSSHWTVFTEDGYSYKAKQVLLTTPLPQALEVMQNSNLSFEADLSSVQYSKAIVLLISAGNDLSSSFNYRENFDEDIFSICSQHAKGNSPSPAWTVVMSADWSGRHFSLPDDQILSEAKKVVEMKVPSLRIKSIELKKWRYCQPEKIWKNLFENPHPGLYLAGDAFGGPSLTGALISSYGLIRHLTHHE